MSPSRWSRSTAAPHPARLRSRPELWDDFHRVGSALSDLSRRRLAATHRHGPRGTRRPRHAPGGAPPPAGTMTEPPIAHPWFAALYDRLTAAAERGFMGRVRAEIVGSTRGRVLEIGCGTGANFRHYGEAATAVVATEPDPHMLERAERRAKEIGRPIALRQAPAEDLPFPDCSFDVVLSTLVLCTVRDPVRALAEMRRVL